MAVAGVAGGHDAVEHVHAREHAVDQVFGCAHAHQITRLARRQLRCNVSEHSPHVFFGLAHTQAADGVAGQIQCGQADQRLVAQALEHAALNDAEQRIRVLAALKFIQTATRPTQAEFHRRARLCFGGQHALGVIRRAFVELHDDVGIQRALHLHAHFGCEEKLVAVHRRRKAHTFFADFSGLTKRPHLKAATVGEDGFLPVLKPVQAAELRQDVHARAKPEVKGVAQNNLRAHGIKRRGHDAFDRAVGSHRHEDGGLHHAVIEGKAAAPCLAFGFEQVEFQHLQIVQPNR